jgi:3-hydroxymyristoyl/3-hydroxydecanoyl-(acyl carrier protein) dehydratase
LNIANIQWVEDGSLEHQQGQLRITPDCPYFEGHFPNNPILPGFVQIRWAVLACCERFEPLKHARLSRMSRIKFKRPIGPDTDLKLTLVRKECDIRFAYADDQGTVTEGRLHFDV